MGFKAIAKGANRPNGHSDETLPEGNTLEGILSRRVFVNEEQCFMIAKVRVGAKELSVLGNYTDPQVGLQYSFTGEWKNTKYGPTFYFDTCQPSFPKDLQSIRAYLDGAKWIGPSISTALISRYGDEAIDICMKEPERVAGEITGLSLEKAESIAAELADVEDSRDYQLRLLNLLMGIPIPKRVRMRIEATYKGDTPTILEADPYALIGKITGYSFLTADKIATRVGISHTSERRIRAGIRYFFDHVAASDGHTCMLRPEAMNRIARKLGLTQPSVRRVFDLMLEESALIEDQGWAATTEMWGIEAAIASKLQILVEAKGNVQGKPKYEGLFDDQKEALEQAMESPVFIVTGPPGTGKTRLMRSIIESYPNALVELAAPTGKAAKRLSELAGMHAQTIHKLLEAGPLQEQEAEDTELGEEPKDEAAKIQWLIKKRELRMKQKKGNMTFGFKRNASRPLEADVIAIDEMSMVDVKLMNHLLKAIVPPTRLILVGDIHQLPPVSAGNVLRDLLFSGRVPSCELTTIKRQDPGLIITNCHAIKNGWDITVDNEGSDFFFLDRRFGQDIQDAIVDLVTKTIPEKYGLDSLKDIQVISPTRDKTTRICCKDLNARLQAELNPLDSGSDAPENLPFRIGDKVIQTSNDYMRGIVNGDIGYVEFIDMKNRTIKVKFEEDLEECSTATELPLFENDLELAYAVTVHKFQGSEAPAIILPVHAEFFPGLTQRSLLYTAISRAQKVCYLVGHRHEVPAMIGRNTQHDRHTFLQRFLEESDEGELCGQVSEAGDPEADLPD